MRACCVVVLLAFVLAGCASSATPVAPQNTAVAATSSAPPATAPAVGPTSPVSASPGAKPPATAAQLGGTPSSQPAAKAASPAATVVAVKRPAAVITPQITVQPATRGKYVVFSWNDLGMHCLNPTYDQAVILPPYNTVWAQVIERGPLPRIVTQSLTVEYRIINNTYSANKVSFGQFWANAQKLFGATLAKDTGLNLDDPSIHNGLSGSLVAKGDHFQVNGIPLTPIDDSGNWNPYQVAEITVKDSTGAIVASTRNTVPTSDEINCAKCHGDNAFLDVLQKHDQHNKTNLVSQQPVLCASCHGSPALGQTGTGQAGYLSARIHGFHGTLQSPPQCADCHPGAITQCNRSAAHTAAGGNCTSCHGDLKQVSNSITAGGRVPWVSEPQCSSCHSGIAQVDTGTTLYRNAQGHGGVYCTACHSSPHVLIPSLQGTDNYQALQYQPPQRRGRIDVIGSCAACHPGSHGGAPASGGIGEFSETHAGANPERPSACSVCHTEVTTSVANWPHSFQWKAR